MAARKSFLNTKYRDLTSPDQSQPDIAVTFANNMQQVVPTAQIGLTLDGYQHDQSVLVMETPSAFELILGQEWIVKHQADLLYSTSRLSFTEHGTIKTHCVPVPPHLRTDQFNSLISNTVINS